MARSGARAPVLAIFGALAVAAFQQLWSVAFVSPTLSSGHRSQSQVVRLATAPEIAEAERHLKLVAWAAKKAAEEGMPQAPMMQAKAQQAAQALEALKQQESGEAPAPAAVAQPAAVAAAPRAQPAALAPATAEEIAELEKHVKLLVWAAKTAAAKGMPQAAAAQVRADEAAQRLAQLKEQQEGQQGGRSAAAVPAPSTPAAAPAVAAPAVALGTVSAEQVAEAEKRAQLAVWAAKKTAEEGMPQAPMMQAKADEAVRTLEALKEALAQQEAARPRAVPAQPAAPAAPAPVAPSAEPTRAELEEVKKEMRLLVWAAKTAEEKGMPQADMMRGKRDAKVQEYEGMMRQLEPAR